jgi:Protein of unknown function (DUF2934)
MATKPSKKPRKTTSAKPGTPEPTPPVNPMGQAGKSGEQHVGEFQRAQQRIEEEIRIRAYAFFEERGRQEGYDREDWERAEAEVLAKYQRAKSA